MDGGEGRDQNKPPNAKTSKLIKHANIKTIYTNTLKYLKQNMTFITPSPLHNTVNRWCIIELYTRNLCNFINQCHLTKFNKKEKI